MYKKDHMSPVLSYKNGRANEMDRTGSQLTDLMSELYPKEQTPQLALEEVELSDDGKFWHVIVSFSRQHAKSTIEAMTGQQGTTTYKKLEIHAETGLVHAMRMHQV